MKKMKRAFTTLACMDAGIDEIIEYALRANMQGVEIRLDNDQKICGIGLEGADEIKAKFDAAGVALTDLATGVSFSDYNAGIVEKGKACIDLASAAGSAAIRVFVGGGLRYFSDPVKQNVEGIARALGELCKYAADKNVEIWAETHSAISTAASMMVLVDMVDADNLKVLWDIIHTIEFNETPLETLRLLGDKLAHIHLKDGKSCGDRNVTQYEHTKLGYGDMPLDSIMTLLAEQGYDGYLSLEWELPWRPELRGCYKDTDETLAAYNSWLDAAENNAFPPFSDERWNTYMPPNRELADFERGTFGQSVKIKVASNNFGVGKWLCQVPVETGATYALNVACKTDVHENDVYVVLTQKKADDKWVVREHAADAYRDGEYIRFSDRFKMEEDACQLEIELWLKGKYAEVEWLQPTLVKCDPIPKRMVRVAPVHILCKGPTLEENCKHMLEGVDRAGAHKPDIIILGEGTCERGVDLPLIDKAETEKGIMPTALRKKAIEYNCYIVYNYHERENGEIHNTSLLIGRDGKTVGKYHKTHLTVGELEKGMTPGEEFPVFDLDFGRVGMLICWDHYFSATNEALAAKGVELVCVSTAGDATVSCLARAKDAGVYYAVAGMNMHNDYGWGPTRVVDHHGNVIASTGEDLTPVVVDIDLNDKPRAYWLSLGGAKNAIHGVYRFEKNPHCFEN